MSDAMARCSCFRLAAFVIRVAGARERIHPSRARRKAMIFSMTVSGVSRTDNLFAAGQRHNSVRRFLNELDQIGVDCEWLIIQSS